VPRRRLAKEPALTRIESALRRIQADLEELRGRWALIGGLAVSARTTPRFTRDLDLAVAVPDDEAAESLVRELVERGYRLLAITEQEAASRLATARLAPPGESEPGLVIDLLFASSGIEGDIVAAAETIDLIESLPLPVARAGHLLALKVLSRDDDQRPQDAADIRALVEAMEASDVKLALEAARLIEARGFGRSRNVVAGVQDALAVRGK